MAGDMVSDLEADLGSGRGSDLEEAGDSVAVGDSINTPHRDSRLTRDSIRATADPISLMTWRH